MGRIESTGRPYEESVSYLAFNTTALESALWKLWREHNRKKKNNPPDGAKLIPPNIAADIQALSELPQTAAAAARMPLEERHGFLTPLYHILRWLEYYYYGPEMRYLSDAIKQLW